MPSIDVKEKKWYRTLISCFSRQKRNESDDRDRPVLLFKNEFELRLLEENLLYRGSGCNDHPVLNIGIGLTRRDLCGKPSNYRYYGNYRQPGIDLFIHPGFEHVVEEVYYDEPIIDGLPATLWLECIEPTLDILSSLSILKHRKSNLVTKKPRPTKSDSHFNRHGDFEMGVVEMLSRRLRSALNRSIGEIQNADDEDNAHIAHRYPNRRRHERDERGLLNLNQFASHDDDLIEEERVLLNINQSANHDDDAVDGSVAADQPNSSSFVQQDNLNPDISTIVGLPRDTDDSAASRGESYPSVQHDNLNPVIVQQDDDDGGDEVAADERESSSSAQHYDPNSNIAAVVQQDDDDNVAADRRESRLSIQQNNLNIDIPAVVHGDDGFVLEDLESLDEWELPAKYNPALRDSDRGEERGYGNEMNTAMGGNSTEQNLSRSRKKTKRKRAIKPHPHLYFWKPEIRQFEKMELRNYPLNILMLIKCGVKYYFQIDDKNNENEFCNRLTYLSRMDFFTRRLIMSSTEEFFNKRPAQEITSQEIENAQRFLQLKGISPKYGASRLSEVQEANMIESPKPGEGFFRRKINNIRHFFSHT